MPDRSRRALAASAIAVALLSSTVPIFVFSDQAQQLRALQAFVQHRSPSPNHLVEVVPSDLARDQAVWQTWWAPGVTLAAWPFVAAGLSIGQAVKGVAMISYLAGCVGWLEWWRRSGAPAGLLVGVGLLLPWMRQASNSLFQFSADAFVFAVAPWILITAHGLSRAREGLAARGLLLGWWLAAGFWLKFSLAFLAPGVLLYLAWVAWSERRVAVLRAAIIAGAVCLAGMALHSWIGVADGRPANLVLASLRASPAQAIFSTIVGVANAAMAIGDFGALAAQFTKSHLLVALIAAPAGAWLVWSAIRAWQRSGDRAAGLGAAVFVSTIALFGLARGISNGISLEPRHVQVAGLALAPVAVMLALRRAALSTWSGRLMAALVAVFVIVPGPIYGPLTVGVKLWRPQGFEVGTSGLYNFLLARTSVPAVVDSLRAEIATPGAVWYLPEPLTALDLPVRAVVSHADFMPIDELKQYRFSPAPGQTIFMMAPPKFESNGKGEVIRESFGTGIAWSRRAVDGSYYDLWTGRQAP